MSNAKKRRKERRKDLQPSAHAKDESVPAGTALPSPPQPPHPEPPQQMPPSSPPPSKPPEPALPNRPPWYEGTLLWGLASIVAALVITAITARQFRWMVLPACPLLWVCFWAAVKSFTPKAVKMTLLLVLCLVTGGGAEWLYRWLEPPTFTAQQRKDFTAILKTAIAVPAATLLACPKTDEDACAYAAEFIPLFQRAGWTIEGPQVERVELQRATRSILIVIPGPNLVHPQNPDEGVYTKLPIFEQPLKSAFEFIGIRPGSVNDTTLQEGKIRVYFGSAPKYP